MCGVLHNRGTSGRGDTAEKGASQWHGACYGAGMEAFGDWDEVGVAVVTIIGGALLGALVLAGCAGVEERPGERDEAAVVSVGLVAEER